jgi:hypothetical protein
MPNDISMTAASSTFRSRAPASPARAAASRCAGPLGKVQGGVVWYLEDGFLIKFARLLHGDFLEDSVTGD